MEDHVYRARVVALLGVVLPIRAARAGTERLMPCDRSLRDEVGEAIRPLVAAGCDPVWCWVLAGLLLYGPAGQVPSLDRYAHAVRYVRRLQVWGGKIQISDADILQLVFVYALGVARPAGRVPRLSVEPAGWGEAHWGEAVLTLTRFLAARAGWLCGELNSMGFRGIEAMNATGSQVPNALAAHAVGMLVGKSVGDRLVRGTPCGCVASFAAAHAGISVSRLVQRHRDQHLLRGWLRRCWPTGRPAGHVYPLREFLFRATVGDDPCSHSFEAGMWFQFLQVGGMDTLTAIRVLTCCGCGTHMSWFDSCPGCGAAWPSNYLQHWLIRESDPRFSPETGWRCLDCRSYMPGVIAERGLTCMACEECNRYSQRPTHFHVRLQPPAPLPADAGEWPDDADDDDTGEPPPDLGQTPPPKAARRERRRHRARPTPVPGAGPDAGGRTSRKE